MANDIIIYKTNGVFHVSLDVLSWTYLGTGKNAFSALLNLAKNVFESGDRKELLRHHQIRFIR